MRLGTEVGLGPGDIVLDGNPAPPPQKTGVGVAQQPPLFGPCLLWPNGRPSQQLLSSCYKCLPVIYYLFLLVTTVLVIFK